jgi:hypothetical protein
MMNPKDVADESAGLAGRERPVSPSVELGKVRATNRTSLG